MEVYQHFPSLPNNMKTVEGILKLVCSKTDPNVLTQCYNNLFGKNKVPFILNVIEHYKKKALNRP